jgi:arylsulfatase A-like enzyme
MSDDVLLITIDSLRADRTGFLGYDRNTTPNLDALATDGLIYEQAQAHGPTTFSSFPSLLTGTHAYRTTEYPTLSGETVAEWAQNAGYHTASVTSNAWVSPTYDYDRGFDSVHALGRGPRSATGPWDRVRHTIGDVLGDGVLFDLAKRGYDRFRNKGETASTEDRIHEIVVDHTERDGPTFTWAHYMTVHAPYEPDPDSGVRFADEQPGEEAYRDLIDRARRSPETLSESERTLLSDLYDDSIRHVDRRIDDLLSAIDLDETVVCITADHGEGLFEHGYFEHPPELHQQLLHVPLVVLSPEVEPRSVTDTVGLESVPALLGRLAGFETPGSPLCPPWNEDSDPVCSAVAHANRFEPETIERDHLKLAARDDNWKLILSNDDPRLYDIGDDHDEDVDLSASTPDVRRSLAEHATAFGKSFVFGESREIPDEITDQLSELGYLE